jgi:hypothetical protein
MNETLKQRLAELYVAFVEVHSCVLYYTSLDFSTLFKLLIP